jgi:HK97 family phage portal protein
LQAAWVELRGGTGEVSFEDPLLQAMLGGGGISKEKALQVPTVAGGVDLIAGIVAGTPIKLYRDGPGKAEEVKNDPRLRLLNDETGDTLNANEFWRAMVRDYYLGKGGYAYIRKEKGEFAGLHYVDEAQVAVLKNEDPIFKDFKLQVGGRSYEAYDFLKILRDTKDGAQGTPITKESGKLIEVAYESLCYELYLVKKGGNKKGFLKSAKRLDADSLKNLKDGFAKMYSNNSDNVVVLNEGLDFQESSNTSVEMQLNENKRTNADEFSKIFHIAPGVMEGSASDGDVASLARLAAIPLMTAIQCALNRDLLLRKSQE